MPVSLIVTLIETLGPKALDLIDTLIAKWSTNGSVTAAEWATLSAMLKQSASDRMKLALTAQGIDPASAQGIALIALTQ